MSDHTKGRLKICSPRWLDDTDAALIICDEAGSSLTIMSPGDPFITEQRSAANARRLVACWNACEGISTDALEHIHFDPPSRETAPADLAEARELLKITIAEADGWFNECRGSEKCPGLTNARKFLAKHAPKESA